MFASILIAVIALSAMRCSDGRPRGRQVEALPQQKIRIKLRSFEHENLTDSCKKIVDAAGMTGATVCGPVPLPTKRRLYCVLRSPHVNKNSMEHFQILTHQRLIDLKNPSAQTIGVVSSSRSYAPLRMHACLRLIAGEHCMAHAAQRLRCNALKKICVAHRCPHAAGPSRRC